MRDINKNKEFTILKKSETDKIKVFVSGGGGFVSKDFYKDAYEVGRLLAKLNTAYGQGGQTDKKTIMGESYFGYKENGGSSVVVFAREEHQDDMKSEFDNYEGAYLVDGVSGLVKIQYFWSDITVFMPGGTGTLTELICYMEQCLDYPFSPKIILYNKDLGSTKFFDSFKEQIEIMVKNNFISRNVYESFVEVNDLKSLKKEIKLAVKELSKIKA